MKFSDKVNYRTILRQMYENSDPKMSCPFIYSGKPPTSPLQVIISPLYVPATNGDRL